MLTYQDFLQYDDKAGFISRAIGEHQSSDAYRVACDADRYDHQLNTTIHNYVRMIFTLTGTPVEDFTASNNKIASNFFHRLNTQRNVYLLGNGVSFANNRERVTNPDGTLSLIDRTKEMLGNDFDTALKELGYYALIHGVAFGFWNLDTLHVFPLTEFVPLWDEGTGALRAGVRYWRLADNKPMTAVLYEEDGYTTFRTEGRGNALSLSEPKRAYKTIVRETEADGEQVIGEENYGSLPIVPMWGSNLKQSTLVGMKSSIDSYDLIRSGFANDLTDCAQIYWILENCGGMSDSELARFRDRLKVNHIAVADTQESKVTPFTQEIPYAARKEYLDMIRAGIYEDFGGLDVHTIAAGATNDHIDAAYQAMDEEADDYEFQVVKFIRQILKLNGVDDVPVFKRNRISNQMEQVQMLMLEANYLDDETMLQKLPNVTVDEVNQILARRDAESTASFGVDEQGEDEV